MAARPEPLYSVYRAGAWSVTCYRWVSQSPAPIGDFLSFMEAGTAYEWWDFPRAVGVSFWDDREKASALAKRKEFPLLAELDLARMPEQTPWAYTGASGHITVWGPAPLLVAAVVNYIEV
jgi:hypothetical protein